MIVLNNVLLKLILSNEKAHAVAGPFSGALDGLKAFLFTNVISPDPSNLWSDMTEPTYPGYAQQAITWGVVHSRPDGSYAIDTQLLTFQMSDATVPTTVQGWGLVLDGTPDVLYAAELLATPAVLVNADQTLQLVGQVALGSADYGDVTQIS